MIENRILVRNIHIFIVAFKTYNKKIPKRGIFCKKKNCQEINIKIYSWTLKYSFWVTSFRYNTSYWYIALHWSISQLTLLDDYTIIIYWNISQEPTISSSNALSLFQPKMLATIDDIKNINKQRPDAEAVYKYISRTEASNVNKTDIENSIDELVK